MKKIILVKDKKSFSFTKYIIFTYFKKYTIYDKYIKDDIFYIPFRKKLKNAYFDAILSYLKSKDISSVLTFDEEIKERCRNYFSIINGYNIYRAIFYDILLFLSENNLYEYEIVFVSDNIKEIKNLIEKCVKKVKSVSVLTEKPYLYESMKDFILAKYGVKLNIRTKKEKLKKHNKIYVNCGANRVFEKNTFKKVNMIDIYNVYEGVYKDIIFEASPKVKEYTKALKCAYSPALAEFLQDKTEKENVKIVNIKK